ncbi:hypothetical protein TUBRATIS_007160 [Tubulinosema ratisbonensis]|uniref:Uncharacterized protein n=1 Tax=Tubulinosema ratisbonensis TaxID=291195 RepID=A0A437AP17_9MICR|nr:hypothetical protein TUBRATIS_007160 [Tubulinosema ratisbonensis]
MKSNKIVEEKKKEIESMGYLRKIPIVTVYVLEKHLLDKIPSNLKKYSNQLKSLSYATITLFSTTILPMMYIYSRDKNEEECILGIN